MMRPLAVRVVPILVLTVVLSSCFDELAELFEIISYEESEDPQTQRVGKVLRKIKEDEDMQDALDKFVESGDPRFIADAKAIRPEDTSVLAYDLILIRRQGDAAAIEAAEQALALAEARRLQGLSRPGDDPTTAEQLNRNVLGEILVAQTMMLGGSLNREWDPPAADADPVTQQLYLDYCVTRNRIITEFNDSLSYIPTPPCPPTP